MQVVELRPIEADPAGCAPGVACYRALAEERSVAATQDLSLTGWGFGVQGLSTTVMLRSRARLGSEVLWPRTDDRFDAVLAYAQLVRGPITVRAGRQEIRSGLGFPSFDGLSAATHGRTGSWHVELYGGRSLARGLREPEREALRGIEDFVPDQTTLLIGGSARLRRSGLSVTGRYQRELLRDRSALVSDRGAIDVSLVTPEGRLLGSIDYDFAQGRPGKGRVSWSRPFQGSRWLVEASALRYVPYFSLSTIWGFFEPVAYHGTELRVGFAPSASWAAWVVGGWRRYGDAGATSVLQPLGDDGRRAELGGRWIVRPELSAEARYRLEWGPGGFLHTADASVRWTRSERLSFVASATSFQQVEQYRLGDGRGLGGGLSADATVRARVRLSGGASILRHSGGEAGEADAPWSQSRFWSSVRVTMGADPGIAARSRR